MSDNNTFVLSEEKKPLLTGLQVVILGDVEADELLTDGAIGFTRHLYRDDKKAESIVSEAISSVGSNQCSNEKLSDLFMTICLEYPFWNNFRILDFFNKRGLSMTMEELRHLRSECGLENKEDVCLELMALYFNNEIKLGRKQLQFIERLNPAFRDRDFPVAMPGESLIYECIFFRRLNKMFYLHLVFDLYNGHAFGKVSRRRSGAIGLKLLQEKVIPFYRSRGYKINTLVHSINSRRDGVEAQASNIREKALAMDIKLLEPKHEFGIIQRFQRDWLEPFFNDAEAFDVSLPLIQPAFDRWVIKYNANCPFHQRRNLLGYTDDSDSKDRMDLEAECN